MFVLKRAVLSISLGILKYNNSFEGLKIDKRVSIIRTVNYLWPVSSCDNWQSVFSLKGWD
jgi:hypothetical protein